MNTHTLFWNSKLEIKDLISKFRVNRIFQIILDCLSLKRILKLGTFSLNWKWSCTFTDNNMWGLVIYKNRFRAFYHPVCTIFELILHAKKWNPDFLHMIKKIYNSTYHTGWSDIVNIDFYKMLGQSRDT